jgi:ubiquinone/menaquinone biosynthesis C-methylase UbiE
MQEVAMNHHLTVHNIKDDYNRIYEAAGIRANSAYYRWLIGLLRPKAASRLLDVSCGEGIFLKEFAKRVKDARVYGLDISDKALAKSNANVAAGFLVNADGQYMPFADEQFDCVSCLGSLEHYLDPEKGMRELHRVGKKEAVFCVVLPNSVSIDLLRHVVKHGSRPVDDFQIIERTATRKEWEALLEKNGFKVIKVCGSNLWPELFQEGTFKIKSIGKYLQRKLIKAFCPINLAREFVFICKKK